MNIQNIVSENVKKYRHLTGNTQKDIAAKLDVSLSLYQKLEQGNRHFTFEQIISLCKIFHIGITDLILDGSMEPGQLELLSDDEKKILLGYIMTSLGAGEFTPKDIAALINYHKKFGRSILYVKPNISLNAFKTESWEEKLYWQEQLYKRRNEKLKAEYYQELLKEMELLRLEVQGKQYSKKERELFALKEKISASQKKIQNLDDTIDEKKKYLTQLDMEKMQYEQEKLSELKNKQKRAETIFRSWEADTEKKKIEYEQLVAEQDKTLKTLNDKISKRANELEKLEDPETFKQTLLANIKYRGLAQKYNNLLSTYKEQQEKFKKLRDKNEELQDKLENLRENSTDIITCIEDLPDDLQIDFEAEIVRQLKYEYGGDADEIRALLLLLKQYREYYKNQKFTWPLKNRNEKDFFKNVEWKCEVAASEYHNI